LEKEYGTAISIGKKHPEQICVKISPGVLKISLFSIPSSHDPVIRMLHCFENLTAFLILTFSIPGGK
jgi:hypothetical protein